MVVVGVDEDLVAGDSVLVVGLGRKRGCGWYNFAGGDDSLLPF